MGTEEAKPAAAVTPTVTHTVVFCSPVFRDWHSAVGSIDLKDVVSLVNINGWCCRGA